MDYSAIAAMVSAITALIALILTLFQLYQDRQDRRRAFVAPLLNAMYSDTDISSVLQEMDRIPVRGSSRLTATIRCVRDTSLAFFDKCCTPRMTSLGVTQAAKIIESWVRNPVLGGRVHRRAMKRLELSREFIPVLADVTSAYGESERRSSDAYKAGWEDVNKQYAVDFDDANGGQFISDTRDRELAKFRASVRDPYETELSELNSTLIEITSTGEFPASVSRTSLDAQIKSLSDIWNRTENLNHPPIEHDIDGKLRKEVSPPIYCYQNVRRFLKLPCDNEMRYPLVEESASDGSLGPLRPRV